MSDGKYGVIRHDFKPTSPDVVGRAQESRAGKQRGDALWDEVQAKRKLAWREGSNCDPYAEGWSACEQGKGRGDNPFTPHSNVYALWDKGFIARSNQ